MLSQNVESLATAAITRDKVQISRLINSIFYFIDVVFILKKDDKYRLIALHRRRELIDSTYPTFRGAKIAFSKFNKDKPWKKDVKAEWSHFYNPDKSWLADTMP